MRRVATISVVLTSLIFSAKLRLTAANSVVCDSLQDLCPYDNSLRMCTCVITTGNGVRWRTSRTGVFNGEADANFLSGFSVGANTSANGFTAIFTNNTVGHLTSILTFTPNIVSTAAFTVTCDDPSVPNSPDISKLVNGVIFTGMYIHCFLLRRGHFLLSKLCC